jgi:hypothetical protein
VLLSLDMRASGVWSVSVWFIYYHIRSQFKKNNLLFKITDYLKKYIKKNSYIYNICLYKVWLIVGWNQRKKRSKKTPKYLRRSV